MNHLFRDTSPLFPTPIRARAQRTVLLLSLLSLFGFLGCDDFVPSSGGGDLTATWAKSYGGEGWDGAAQTIPTRDGGYIMVGTRNQHCRNSSLAVGCSGGSRSSDVWVVKLDAAGNVEWERTYGDQQDVALAWAELPGVLAQSPDGSIWLAGAAVTRSPIDPKRTGIDLFVARLSPSGQLLCTSTYDSGDYPSREFGPESPGTSSERPVGIHPTLDGGAFIPAAAIATVGPLDVLVTALNVVRVDDQCNEQWNRIYDLADGAIENTGMEAAEVPGGGGWYVVARGEGGLIARLGNDGSLGWSVDLDSLLEDSLLTVAEMAVDPVDGGVILVGTHKVGKHDAGAILKVDSSGNLVWSHLEFGLVVQTLALRCVEAEPEPSCIIAVAGRELVPVSGYDETRGYVRTFDRQGQEIDAYTDIEEGQGLGHLSSKQLIYVSAADEFRLKTGLARETTLELDAAIVALTPGLEYVSHSYFQEEEFEDVVFEAPLVPGVGGAWLGLTEDSILLADATAGLVGSLGLASAGFGSGGLTYERGWAIAERTDGGYTVMASHRSSPWLLHIDEAGGEISSGAVADLAQVRIHGRVPSRAVGFYGEETLHGVVVPQYLGAVQSERTSPVFVARQSGGAVFVVNEVRGFQVVVLDELGARIGVSDRVPGDPRALEQGPDGDVWVLSSLLNAEGQGELATVTLTRFDSTGTWVSSESYTLSGLVGSSSLDGPMHLLVLDSSVVLAGTLGGEGVALERPVESGEEVETRFYDFDVEGSKMWAVRLDPSGAVLWSRTYDFPGLDRFDDVRLAQAPEGAIALGASWMVDPYGRIEDAEISARVGRRNIVLALMDEEGEPQWSRLYGGLYEEFLDSITSLPDGGFILSSRSDSLGDLGEAWVIRTAPDGSVTPGCNAEIERGLPIEAGPLEVERVESLSPFELDGPSIEETEYEATRVLASSPTQVARQCFGRYDPGAGERELRRLEVRIDGMGGGLVRSILPGGVILCGNLAEDVCEADLERGSVVVLNVEPDIGFGGWLGCDDILNGDQCRVTLDTDREVVPYFYSVEERVTFDVTTIGLGHVNSTHDIHRCGLEPGECSTIVPPAGAFAMTPVTEAPNSFLGWGGDCASFGTDPVSYAVVRGLPSPQSCVAEFTALRDVQLRITGGLGFNVIRVPSQGVDIDRSETRTFPAFETVALEAYPRGGDDGFNRWACYRRDEPPSNPDLIYTKELELDVERWESCDAQFLRGDQGRRLNLTLDPGETLGGPRPHSVRVYSAPGNLGGGVGCLEDCSTIFDKDARVVLTPMPEFGWADIISHTWEGCPDQQASTITEFDGDPVFECVVLMDELKNVTLRYEAGGNSGAPDAPNVTFDWTPEAGIEVGDPVSFDSAGTFGLTPLTYFWDFENDASHQGTHLGPAPIHTYTTAKTRRVRLRVVDARGRFSQVMRTIDVATGIPRDPIQVFVVGTGSGTVTFDPERTECTESCFREFDRGRDVKLIAEADPGSQFVAWSGNGACIDGTVGQETTVEVPELGLACTVTFDSLVPPKRTLDVTFAGDGSGTLTFAPGTADEQVCTDSCSVEFDHGTQAIFIFQIDPGSGIPAWTGDADCGDGDAIITFDADKACTLTVNELPPPPEYTLSVSLDGTGTGGVVSNPAGIDCPGDCGEDYVSGSAIVLTATADVASEFVGWSGDAACTNSVSGNQTIIEPIANTACVATFDLISVGTEPLLTVTISGDGDGRAFGTGIDCGEGGLDCAERFPTGTEVILTAVSAADSIFDGWYGDPECQIYFGEDQTAVTMDDDIACDARFVLADPGTIAVANTGFGYGTVTMDPGGSCRFEGPFSTPRCQTGYGGSGVFAVLVTAVADLGSTFNGWTNCPAVDPGNPENCFVQPDPSGVIVLEVDFSY